MAGNERVPQLAGGRVEGAGTRSTFCAGEIRLTIHLNPV